MSSKLSLSGKDLFVELILGDSKLVLPLTIMSMIYLNYVVNAETFNANTYMPTLSHKIWKRTPACANTQMRGFSHTDVLQQANANTHTPC